LNRLPLFVYGTLRDPDIIGAVLGRALKDGQARAATAPGYGAVHMPGRVYPGLVRRPGDAAPGLVLSGLSSEDHDVLDAFEGEEYRRQRIMVICGPKSLSAEAYLPVEAIAGDTPAWTLEAWTRLHKSAVLAKDSRTTSEQGEEPT